MSRKTKPSLSTSKPVGEGLGTRLATPWVATIARQGLDDTDGDIYAINVLQYSATNK